MQCYTPTTMPPSSPEYTELKALLEETRALAKDNNRLLREMRRNAFLSLIAKVVIWLLVLGAIPLILGPLVGPLMGAFTGQASVQTIPSGVFGLPSQDQLNQLIDQYQAAYQE